MSDPRWSDTPTLSGAHVVLEPLSRVHVDGLREVLAHGNLSKLWYTLVPSPDTIDDYVDTALAEHAAGRSMPFAVRDRSGTLVGSTRYCRMEPAHRRLEIGYTWYAESAQRTALNTEAKLLLLGHAFEAMDCIAVEFRTHRFNRRSRAAIERLGAQLDGILRNHMLMPDGSRRDTAVYSILDSEWDTVKRHLEFERERSE